MEENLRLDSRQAHSGRWLDSSPTRPPAVREYNLSAQLLARRSFWVGWLGLRLYVQLIRLRCSHKQAAMAGLTEDGVPPQSRRGFAWGGRVIKKKSILGVYRRDATESQVVLFTSCSAEAMRSNPCSAMPIDMYSPPRKLQCSAVLCSHRS